MEKGSRVHIGRFSVRNNLTAEIFDIIPAILVIYPIFQRVPLSKNAVLCPEFVFTFLGYVVKYQISRIGFIVV